MDIKAFTVGQTAYMYDNANRTVFSIDVTKIGRKYLTVANREQSVRFASTDSTLNYLISDSIIGGEPLRLFATAQAYTDYKKHRELVLLIHYKLSWKYLNKYTTEQLEAIKGIIE